MALDRNEDYVLIDTVDVPEGIGFKMTQGLMVGTKKKLFVMPIKTFGSYLVVSTTSRFKLDGQSPRKAIKGLLNALDITVDKLETTLTNALSDSKTPRVFAIDSLERFRIGKSFMKMTLVQPKGGKLVKINVRGKQAKQELASFYGQ